MSTKTQCNSKNYKSGECPYLHSHLWDPSKMKGAPKYRLAAAISEETVDRRTELTVQFNTDVKPDKHLDGITMVDLAAALKTINKKIEELKVMRMNKNSISPIIPAKPNILIVTIVIQSYQTHLILITIRLSPLHIVKLAW